MIESNKIATMAVDESGERVIKISFPYDLTTLYNIRTLPGRKWHPEIKCWSSPLYLESLNMLVSWGFTLDDKLQSYIEKVNHKKVELIQSGVSNLKEVLFPFQSECVALIDYRKGRALVADDPGLGKTIEAIAWLQLHNDIRPAILVVPGFLKDNWDEECHKWMPNPNTCILKGTTPYTFKGDIIIINYDILADWYQELRKCKAQVLIMDECHLIKSNSAKRTKAMKMLTKGIPNVIAISGTPLLNRPIELYNAINIINPNLFPNRWSFVQRFCNPKYNGFGWNFNGASNVSELHHILSTTIMIRRKKEDVLKDLPEKIKSFVSMDLTNWKEYLEAEYDFVRWLKKEKGADAVVKSEKVQAMAKIETLKQLCIKGKLKSATEWIENFLDSGQKLVTFVTHTSTINSLVNSFPKIAVKMDGSIKNEYRQSIVNEFQNNPDIRLFIGMLDVQGRPGGMGWTLTAASCTATLELQWGPLIHKQADDRVHRISQKNAVINYYLLAKNTIEERIAKIQDQKLKIANAVIDGEETDESSLLFELMKSYE